MSKNISDEQREQIRQIMEKYDTDRSGDLDKDEFRNVIYDLNGVS